MAKMCVCVRERKLSVSVLCEVILVVFKLMIKETERDLVVFAGDFSFPLAADDNMPQV